MPTVNVGVGIQRDYSRYSSDDPGFSQLGKALPATEKAGKVSLRGAYPVAFPFGTIIPSFTFPLAPTEISLSDLSDNYEELKRPGRFPLIYRSDKNLIKISITVLIVSPIKASRGWVSVEEQVQILRVCSNIDMDLALAGMGIITKDKLFRVTSMSLKSKRLNPKQEITMAEVSLDLTEAGEKRVPIPGMIAIKDIPDPQNPNQQTATAPGGSPLDPWSNAYYTWIK